MVFSRHVSIEKFGFRLWKSDFRSCNKIQNPKSDFNFYCRNSASRWISIKIPKVGFHGFSSLPFYWKIRKRICETVFGNTGLFLLTMHVCAGLLFLRMYIVFLKSIFAFPNKTEGNLRQSKDRFLTIYICSWISHVIENHISGFQNL